MLRGGNEGGYWEELEWRERLKGWCDQNIMCLCMEVNFQLNGNVGWSIKNEKRGRLLSSTYSCTLALMKYTNLNSDAQMYKNK